MEEINKIDDTARGLPMTPATAAITAMSMMGEKKLQTACCPKDGEPLVFSLKYPGAEFVCMVCGKLYGFLAPVPKPSDTPGLQERHEELQARFDAGEKPGAKQKQ